MEHEKETDPIKVHSLVVTGIRREEAELLELDLNQDLKKEDRSEHITLPLAETSLTSAGLLCSDMPGATWCVYFSLSDTILDSCAKRDTYYTPSSYG